MQIYDTDRYTPAAIDWDGKRASFFALREIEEGQARKRLLVRAQMSMREPGEYGNDEVPIRFSSGGFY